MKTVVFLFCIATLMAISNSAAQVVSITATDSFATEEPGETATFQISRDGGIISSGLAVDIGINNANTQANSSDYTLNPPLAGLVIPAGVSSITVTMTATDDFAAEAVEELTLEVLANVSYTVGANSQATANIDANDFGVTNTNDFDPFFGSPTPQQREGTLRQAIENAHDFGAKPIITFSDAPFTIGPQRTISLTGGEFFIVQEMSIQGPGADHLALEGFNLDRILNISDEDESLSVAVSGIEFRAGTAFITGLEGRGGAILAGSGGGDGINLTLTECTFTENRAIEGAAVAFFSEDGTLAIERCLFEDNLSSSEGGALAFYSGSTLTVRDSTFARNQSSGRAGALLVLATAGSAEIVNATIVGNRTDENDGGQVGDAGGGLFVATGATCTIHNTLIAGNLRGSSTPADDDIAGNVAAGSRNNLIGDLASAGGLSHGVLENIIGMEDEFNPGLRVINPLRNIVETQLRDDTVPLIDDHGGPTRAVRLTRSSLALEEGDPTLVMSVNDQRGDGFPRDVPAFPDFSFAGFGTPDIGAIEFDPILVTTVTDEDDGTPDPGSGDGASLREAIAKANLHPGSDLVLFSRGNNGTTDFFDVTDPKTMRPSKWFNVRTSIDIDGPGSFFLTLDGDVDLSGTANDGDTRLFVFSDPIFAERTPSSSLSDVTLANGSNWEESILGNGGAILNDASLVVSRVVVENNTAVDGGAIYSSGALNLIHATLDSNTAQRNGGGLYSRQILFAGQLSTFSNNTASQSGGGIYTESGSFQLLNSTLSANDAADGGGLFYENGNARIANSTIAENTASNSTAGAGIHISAAIKSPTLEVDNTIIAGNLINPGAIPSDIAGGALTPASIHNLIGDPDTAGGLTDGDNGNIVGDGGVGILNFSSLLEPIGFNGGFTETYLPAFGSFVIDSGDDSSASFRSGTPLRTDQRGEERIVGFAVDIGSVEIDAGLLELDPIDDQFVGENDFVFFTASATDNSGIGGNIIFSLEDGAFGFVPDGASIDPGTGDFSWQTEEFDGPGFYEFDVVATLEDDGSVSDRQTIFIDVFEINENPFIDPIDDMTVEAGMELAFSVNVFDPDIPENVLTFSLDSTSEALGMSIDPDTGEFRWTPASPGNFPVEITVEDDGGGDTPLADIANFNIQVTSGSMPVVWLSSSIPTAVEPDSFSRSVGFLANFALRRSSAIGAQTVTVQIDDSSQAGFGIDFDVTASIGATTVPLTFAGTTPSATVTIPDGATEVSFAVRPIDDFAAEPDEQISFSIVPDPTFELGTQSVVNTILQNDYGVTNTDDFDPETTPAGGEGTLRQAVINAKAGLVIGSDSPIPAQINFQTGLRGEILLGSGPLLLDTSDFTIEGPGSDFLTVSASLNSRVFIVYDPASDRSYSISGLRIDSGLTSGNGGGIFNSESLQLSDCIVSNCFADNGGGITNEGILDLERCLVTSNAAAVYGGGIDNHTGTLDITGCTISDNTAAFGGGIEDHRGDLTSIAGSTIIGNTASSSGGGIDVFGSRTGIINTTITGNNAGFGAGVFNEMSALVLTYTTVAENTANSSTGGVLTTSKPSDVIIFVAGTILNNTIVAGNSSGDLSTDDPSFADVSALSANNLIGDAESAGGLVDGTNSNFVGIGGTGIRPLDTVLAPLADNGGPTLTRALISGSPAIDAGGDEDALGTGDQRGLEFTRVSNGTSDIGAFEVQPEILEAVSCELSEGPAAKITWRSAPDETYEVLCSIDLKNWITVAEEVPATGALTSFTDENPPPRQAYFIVRKSRP